MISAFSSGSFLGLFKSKLQLAATKKQVALQAALDNSTEQMAELITALTESPVIFRFFFFFRPGERWMNLNL